MKIAPSDVATLYAAFVDNEIAPKAATGVQRFLAYGSVYMVNRKVGEYLSDPRRVEQLRQAGIMDENGMIDMDYVREMATFALQKSGGKIQAMGLILDQGDIDTAYRLAQHIATGMDGETK